LRHRPGPFAFLLPRRRPAMKINLTIRPPRNPLTAPARFRHAGVHRRHAGGQRQQALRELQRELERTKPSP
jgi:hypothetical protein